MNDERDDTIEQPSDEPATEPAATEPTAVEPEAADPAAPVQTRTGDDFLVPGPSPESNEGLARWGLTWIAFSLILILLMLCVSFVCLTLANWTGFA